MSSAIATACYTVQEFSVFKNTSFNSANGTFIIFFRVFLLALTLILMWDTFGFVFSPVFEAVRINVNGKGKYLTLKENAAKNIAQKTNKTSDLGKQVEINDDLFLFMVWHIVGSNVQKRYETAGKYAECAWLVHSFLMLAYEATLASLCSSTVLILVINYIQDSHKITFENTIQYVPDNKKGKSVHNQ